MPCLVGRLRERKEEEVVLFDFSLSSKIDHFSWVVGYLRSLLQRALEKISFFFFCLKYQEDVFPSSAHFGCMSNTDVCTVTLTFVMVTLTKLTEYFLKSHLI